MSPDPEGGRHNLEILTCDPLKSMLIVSISIGKSTRMKRVKTYHTQLSALGDSEFVKTRDLFIVTSSVVFRKAFPSVSV